MINSDIKEKAINALKKSTEGYNSALENIREGSENLFQLRTNASTETIVDVEKYINQLANKPKVFSKEFKGILADFSNFNHYIHDLQKDAKRVNYTAGSTTGAGVLMGAGVAALGPTTAIAVATTFGAASTGTAIAALSGAAASNAALAWLGGGALVAGGGGMAAGEALLLLAGPVGWGIAALSVTGGVLLMRHKNKKIADEATSKRIEIEGYRLEREAMNIAIKELAKITKKQIKGINGILATLADCGETDYRQLDSSQKDMLQALVNHTHALGQLLRKLPEGATQS